MTYRTEEFNFVSFRNFHFGMYSAGVVTQSRVKEHNTFSLTTIIVNCKYDVIPDSQVGAAVRTGIVGLKLYFFFHIGRFISHKIQKEESQVKSFSISNYYMDLSEI